MKRTSYLLLLMVMAITLGSCGPNIPSVSVELSPEGGGQAVDATVTATFGSSVVAPLNWADYFTLKQDGGVANLCTDYAFDNTTDPLLPVVTCEHDDLENNTSYIIVMLSGIVTGADTTQGNFSTVP